MAVITISRQLGSAGDYIAGLLVSAMSYKLINMQSLIMEAQRRGAISPEIADEMGEGKPPLIGRFDRRRTKAIYDMRSILRNMAIEGNAVVLGRGGQIELKDRTDLLRVRIISNFEDRLSRIEREEGVARAQAAKMLKESDRKRCQYTKHFFLADCNDPEIYDIVINTSRISPDAAARLIQQAARQFGS